MGRLGIDHGVGNAEPGDGDEAAAARPAADCESFTFMSCSDFTSSSLRYFSDCEGGDSDSDSYIEIEVDCREAITEFSSQEEGGSIGGGGGGGEELLQLRISISSTAPFPELYPSSLHGQMDLPAVNESVVLSGLNSTSSDIGIEGKGCRVRVEEEQTVISSDRGRGSSPGRAKFAAVYRLLNTVASSMKVSPEICQRQDGVFCHQNSPRHFRVQQPKSKDTSNMKNGTRVMQFLFKLRTMQFRTFMSSLVKSRPVSAKGKAMDKFSEERRLEETLNFHHRMAKGSGRKAGVRNAARNMSMRSCPSSIKCSPINQDIYADEARTLKGECAIQAAIAHCKKSLGSVSRF